MNRITISAIAVGVFAASTLAMAQTPAAVPMKTEAAKPMPGMDMKGQMAQMDFRINEMQAMHEKMMKATTPEARRLIMEEQRKVMRESMGMMNQMMPSGGMMAGQGGGMMAGQGGGMMAGQGGGMMANKAGDKPAEKAMPGDMGAQMPMMQEHMAMMQMMQKRTDMMQMMMQTMMDQQGMMGGPKGPDAAPKK